MSDDRPDILIRFRFLADDLHPDKRLKQLLKLALRVYGMRDVWHADVKPGQEVKVIDPPTAPEKET